MTTTRFRLSALTLALALPMTAPLQAGGNFSVGGVDFDVSLTLDGVYYNRFSGDEAEPAGFGHDHDHDHDHGHHHGHDHDHGFDNGFNAGHSEIAVRARTDLLDGVFMLGFTDKDVEVEEAYLQTRALPAGLQIKAGKFLSDIGYVNSRHAHDWDFLERPLVNEYLFGHHGLQEVGAQVTYTPATDTFMVFGAEFLQGNGEGLNEWNDKAYHDKKSGPRMVTAFAKFGPDLGDSHGLQLGVSGGLSRQYARVDDHGNHYHTVEGDAWFAGLDAMYRYESGRAYGQGNWRVGGEYYYTQRSVNARGYSENRDPHWRQNPNDFTEKQDGLYVEAVYGIAPRWDVGLRAEALGLTNQTVKFHPTEIDKDGTSYRYAAQATWRVRETIFVRGQVTYEDFAGGDAHHDHHGHGHGHGASGSWAFMLQVNALFGSHPAHRF